MFGGGSSAFGASSFGQPSQQPGQSGGLFGGSSTNKPTLFGSSTTNQPSTGGFFNSQQKPSIFSGTGTTGQQTSAFGSQNAGSSMFGTQPNQQSSLFQSTSPFGSTPTVSGSTIKFDPLKSTDSMVRNNESRQINTKHMCITAMKQYENKSLEELRVEDYIANRKGGQAQGSSLFGSTAGGMTSQGLFGASNQPKPGLFSGQTSTAGSLFSTTTSKPSTGLFGATSQPATGGSIFGSTQATSTQSSLFGTGAGGLAKPPQPSIFGTVSQAGQTSTAGSLFSTTTTKPSTGLFGSTSQPAPSLFGTNPTTSTQSGGLFGTTSGLQKPAQPSIFGGMSAPTTGAANTGGFLFAQPSLFGAQATPQTGFTGATTGLTSAGSPPIMLGSNVNVAGIQQAIIDAQLSALPYGDSPLLRSPQSPKEDRQKAPSSTPSGLQRQLRFMAASVDTTSPSTTVVGGNTSMSFQTTRLPTAGADLNTSGSFLYRPLISLPSVGFGPTLGLSSPSSKYYLDSPGSLSKTRSFLTTQENGDENNLSNSILSRPANVRKAKTLDLSVVHKPSPVRAEAVSPCSGHDHTTSDMGTPLQQRAMNDSSLVIVPPLSIDASSLSPSAEKDQRSTDRSPLTDRSQGKVSTPESQSRVKLSRAEYYCEPSKDALQEWFYDGLYHIEAGLTVGRLGYGSVFWRGPFAVRNLNLDEIVHFRNKEIVVYPDEPTKPEIGTELNRPAEVSLERVWPVGKDKQIIKDPDELARLGFREKLERLCLKMGAEFKDYQPSTGTWQFTVPHFSKYGFDEKDDDGNEVVPTSDELGLLAEQRRTQAMIQRAKQPFREIQMVEDMDQSGEVKFQTMTFSLDRRNGLKKPKSEETEGYDYGEFLTTVKKLKYDPNTFETAEPSVNEHRLKKDLEKLVLRNPVNVFEGVSEEMVKNSVLALVCPQLRHAPFNSRRSCRIGFGQNFTYLSQRRGQYPTSVAMSRISIVPCVNEYFEKYLRSNERIDELPYFQKSDLLRWNPPSQLLRLIDLFIVDVKQKYQNNIFSDKDILSLCDSLLLPPMADRGIMQRIRLGLWLRLQLSKIPSTVRNTDSPFYQIYVSLTNGSTKKALAFARDANLYNLALMISMYSVPTPLHIHDLISEQLRSLREDGKRTKTDIYYVKILQLLAGPSQELTASSDHCLSGLTWMQVLGVIIWYWSKPGMELLNCVELYGKLSKNQIINDSHLYS
ncbi:nucleoporin autopeptidase domain-containing protein [Ditylenchus destructor]|uniref:Nuclear pore complex protein Nup98-Nup96 n=1 Tax=Ditylenchus destructor TaxID=166010 RepID=A0AAD4ND72_9BILA|nr:nucleoporin autopeptidase domain-containing protein [Ditylenchus destructor]